MFKHLYRRCIDLAGHTKNSKTFLGMISFIESFIFPIPPDVFIIPMTIAKKKSMVKNSFNRNNWLSSRSVSRLFYRINIL